MTIVLIELKHYAKLNTDATEKYQFFLVRAWSETFI